MDVMRVLHAIQTNAALLQHGMLEGFLLRGHAAESDCAIIPLASGTYTP